MEYGIISRIDYINALELTEKIIEYMNQFTDILVEESTAEHLDLSNAIDSAPLEEMNVDTLITVGGDGTILRALQKLDAAIFAVNMGRVGFLTEVPGEQVEEHLGRLLEGDYIIEQRSKLRTLKNNEEFADAVNEAVIHTAQISKIRDFNIFVDDVLADNIRADGLIIATPTGSTCYAMSAGSPIIDPRIQAHVVVPIAPYKLSTRPMVVPASSEIRIEEVEGRESVLVIDGQHEEKIGDDVLHFTRSPKTARFIRFQRNFYERVREKFLR
ncbi:MAG: NAD(+)/NADH kinase [Thermoplasmata archaeon]|nr:NAD(+)/NADH kinase [Thermoplasmata archaeon]